MPSQPTSRRLVSTQQCAIYESVSERTIRNYIAKGYFPAYRTSGIRGLVVDLNEVEAAMRRLPARRAKAAFGSYGPNADIRTLPARAVVVPEAEQ